jgi:hypothetical protein
MRSASISNRAVSLVSIVAQIIRRWPAVHREKLKRIVSVAHPTQLVPSCSFSRPTYREYALSLVTIEKPHSDKKALGEHSIPASECRLFSSKF